jgi:pyruvate kinase
VLNTKTESRAVLAELKKIQQSCLSTEQQFAESIAEAPAQSKESIRNLLHYLALRQHDLRDLQRELACMGLSSLGRSESNTLGGLEAVIATLEAISGNASLRISPNIDFETGPARLRENAEQLLGPAPKGRAVRIMVTMPTVGASSYEFVKNLISAGTDVIRINCAHDSMQEWEGMTENVRRANRELRRSCKVLMDLAGPKLRIGAIKRGCHVVHWRVSRNLRGSVVVPARIQLVARHPAANNGADSILPVSQALIRAAKPGDVVHLQDSRKKKRQITIVEKDTDTCVGTCSQGAYVLNGALVKLVRDGKVIARGRVHDLPFVEEPIRLNPKDLLVLTNAQKAQVPLAPATENAGAESAAPRFGRPCDSLETPLPAEIKRKMPRISCTLPEVFSRAKAGEPIFFDDGKVEGVIREVHPDNMLVEIVHTSLRGAKLGSAKGINLPETDLSISAITDKDRQDLDFVVQHADIVGLSFVQRAEDVLELLEELAKRNKNRLGIILKIERRQAFERLPLIMMTALRHRPVGIMVARGDLAIEVGFDRLAEVQEEILWFSEAAHLPVIWATQVLETLAKTGIPSRAEVTDAAMSVRAECVMLNKGEHITDAVRFLDNILQRMQAHQLKKRSMLRRLAVADFAHTTSN